ARPVLPPAAPGRRRGRHAGRCLRRSSVPSCAARRDGGSRIYGDGGAVEEPFTAGETCAEALDAHLRGGGPVRRERSPLRRGGGPVALSREGVGGQSRGQGWRAGPQAAEGRLVPLAVALRERGQVVLVGGGIAA